VLEAVIRTVNDLVDRKGRRRRVWIVAVMLRKRFCDFVQPLVELRRRARIQRREAADNPSLALGDDQLRIRDDEKRRANHRQPKALKNRRKHQAGRTIIVTA
jgi:hypothetical protein